MEFAQLETLIASFRKEVRQKLGEMNQKLDHLIKRSAYSPHGPCDTNLNEFME